VSVRDNTNRRLKEVLDIMAAGSQVEEKPNGGEVLAEAVARVPFTVEESELLSGGIPRGHKNLTKATADLVKAGWMTKGRGGWEITEDGLKATVAFNTVDSLMGALAGGTPVPAETTTPGTATSAKTAAKAPAKDAGVGLGDQPSSVALASDFATVLGSVENWDLAHESAQMRLDALTGKWFLVADLPAGSYSYKAVVNGSWDQNYGAFGLRAGANHEFAHSGGPVSFYYDHVTKDVLRG